MRISDILRAPERRSGLLLAMALSLCIKLILLILLSDEAVNKDGFLYIAAAQEFSQAGFAKALEISPLPLFPLLIAAAHTIIPDWLLAARLTSLVALLISLIPLYLITRDLFGSRAAFFAGLAAALAPYPNEFVIAANRGAVYFCFLAWAVYFSQRAVSIPRPLSFVWAALFYAFAGLCRKEGGVVVVICTVFFVICCLRAAPPERRALCKGILAWAAVFLLPAAAVATLPGSEGALQHYTELIRSEWDRFRHLAFLDHYHQLYAHLKILGQASPYPSGGQNFAEIARHYIAVIYLLGLFEVLVVVMFPPFLIALLAGLRHRPTRSSVLILWIVGWYLVVIYYNHLSRDFVQSRFLFAPAFLLYPWIGSGFEKLWVRWCAPGSPKWRRVLFAGVFFVSALIDTGGLIGDRDPSLADAGRWVKDQAAFRNARRFFNDGRAAFHAGQSWQDFERNYRLWRHGGVPIDDFARKHGFDVVVLLSRSGKKKETRYVLPSFTRRKIFEGGRYAVEIYTLAGAGAAEEAAAGPSLHP
jgi:hypothetical protein